MRTSRLPRRCVEHAHGIRILQRLIIRLKVRPTIDLLPRSMAGSAPSHTLSTLVKSEA